MVIIHHKFSLSSPSFRGFALQLCLRREDKPSLNEASETEHAILIQKDKYAAYLVHTSLGADSRLIHVCWILENQLSLFFVVVAVPSSWNRHQVRTNLQTTVEWFNTVFIPSISCAHRVSRAIRLIEYRRQLHVRQEEWFAWSLTRELVTPKKNFHIYKPFPASV